MELLYIWRCFTIKEYDFNKFYDIDSTSEQRDKIFIALMYLYSHQESTKTNDGILDKDLLIKELSFNEGVLDMVFLGLRLLKDKSLIKHWDFLMESQYGEFLSFNPIRSKDAIFQINLTKELMTCIKDNDLKLFIQYLNSFSSTKVANEIKDILTSKL